ncbi:hypothetical protein L1049_018422 [Liquidambar formosana]|uniref:Uncharacterized protein n=1 Tax=Liquidambar formosana TaxID=63359 RepID=A0AAP0RA25_LIQFO
MDGNSDAAKSPLLAVSEGRKLSQESGRRSRLIRRNSVNSLRREFVSRLPDKIRSGREKEYYEQQFATLKSFDEVDALVGSDGMVEENLARTSPTGTVP